MSSKIFVALSTFAEYGPEPLELLKKSDVPYALNTTGRRLRADEVVELAKNCSGIIAGVEPYREDVLNRLPQLKCISRCGVGLDNIAVDKARELGIVICNTPAAVVDSVAELTVGMILDLLRHITWHTNALRQKKWEKKGGALLKGKRVGILGLGRIGKRVAELLLGFQVKIVAADPHPDIAWAEQHGVSVITLDELLQTADIVSLHLARNLEFPFCLSEREIAMMKDGAMVVNLARGELIDEGALYAALKSGKLQGAALDVFQEEPYRGRFCELDQVLLTPHVATLTRESRLEMEIHAVRNLLDCLLSDKQPRFS